MRCTVPSDPSSCRSIIPVPTTATPGSSRMRRDDPLEPRREGDVVGVHPRDVGAARVLEPDVECAGEPERRLVPHHAQARVVGRREDARPCRRPSRRRRRRARGRRRSGRARSRPPRRSSPPHRGPRGRRTRAEEPWPGGEGSLRRWRQPLRSAAVRPRRRDGRPHGRPRGAARLARGAEARRVPGARRRPERRRSRPVGASRATRISTSFTCARRAASLARGTWRCRSSRLTSSASPTTTACYPPDLLERVAHRFAADPGSAGSAAAPRAADGRVVGRWPDARIDDHARQRLAHRELPHDLPPPRARRARRRIRRGARARLGDAVVVRRGDRLPRARAPARRADRVRPLVRDHAPGQAG